MWSDSACVRPMRGSGGFECPFVSTVYLFQRVLGSIVALATDNTYPPSGGLQLDFVKAAVSGELRRTISQQIITS
jgi:hypothetical protein